MSARTGVSTDGVRVPGGIAEPVHVLFDGVRVWSFQTERDGREDGDDWLVHWPDLLSVYLHGRTRITVQPAGGVALFDEEVGFGDSTQRISVVNRQGHPVAVDKGGRLQHEFTNLGQREKDLIVQAIEQVLHDLRETLGLDAFLSFGCLLGAVREGTLIGHDSDADVSYLSRYSHPYDIAREFRELARSLRGLEYDVLEMSAAHLKIWVPLPDSDRCGIDVFGAYYIDGVFHMLPGVRGDLPRDSLLPTSTVILEGREIVAPARPEDLLAVTYGEGWRVPDPSFKFPHPRDLTRHMAGFWRGTLTGLRQWEEFYRFRADDVVPYEPSTFATWVAERVDPGTPMLDVGCGNGRDAVWWARQGHPVTALDYSVAGRRLTRQHYAEVAGSTSSPIAALTTRGFNLLDVRDVLRTASALSFQTGTRHVYARMLVEELPLPARHDLWRFASMVQRQGGLTFLEFRTDRNQGQRRRRRQGRPPFPDADQIAAEIAERGGRIIEQVHGRGLAPQSDNDPYLGRAVVRWER